MLRVRARLPLVVPLLVCALAGVLTGCGGWGEASPRALSPAGEAAAAALSKPSASDVLHAWDTARAEAFAEGDVAALRRLYLAGAAAGTADMRLLRAYTRRGLRVEGMRVQLLAVEVLHRDELLMRLRVTDRVVGAVAVGRGQRLRLPRDTATTRVVALTRQSPGAAWKVASVRESGPRRAGR